MEKFTKLEQIVVMNALADYARKSSDETKEACFSVKNKLMPILLGKSKEEFEDGLVSFEP